MSSNNKVAEWYRKSLMGDKESLVRLVSAQRSGKALRFYPDGRHGADDEGLVAVMVVPWMKGKTWGISVHLGRATRRVHLRRLQAVQMVRELTKRESPTGPELPSVGVLTSPTGGFIELRLPTAVDWLQMSLPQANGLGQLIRAGLFDTAECNEGVEALNHMMTA